jgi:hypothetical protein
LKEGKSKKVSRRNAAEGNAGEAALEFQKAKISRHNISDADLNFVSNDDLSHEHKHPR